MKKLILIFLLFPTIIFGQPDGLQQANKEIFGAILDSVSNWSLEYASVAAFRLRDSSLVSGAITDNNGNFAIKELTYGRYFLRINYVGYKEKTVGPYVINQSVGDKLDVGNISINLSASSLSEITVSADKPFIEMRLDKRVVNVEGNITVMGGTALDVLQTVPSVSVDMEGTVSLRGSENVTILIDGRPSTLTGASRRATLEQIPANTIESIEIITNPSAKYDPEGTSGIINIVLKKRKGEDTNIITSVNIGTGDKYSANVNISHSAKKFNTYLNYDFSDHARTHNGDLFRQTYNLINSQYHYQYSEGTSNRGGHTVKLGGDYFLNQKHSVGFFVNGNISERNSNFLITNTEKDTSKNITNEYNNNTLDFNDHNSYDINMNYIGKFAKPFQQLNMDINYSSGIYDGLQSNHYHYLLTESNIYDSILSESASSNILAKADYTHPFGVNKKLETGIHVNLRNMESDNKHYSGNIQPLSLEPAKSSKFIFDEDIYAIYGNYSQSMEKWSFSLGTRLEQVFSTPNLAGDTTSYNNDYFSIFPTAAISRKIKEGEELQLSYSKRINRPHTHALNPFINYSLFPNLRSGNPYLKPEYIHSVELSYMKMWKTTTLMPSVFYRHTIDLITRYRKEYMDTLSLATMENVGKANSYGVELIVSQTLAKWWKMNISGSFFMTRLNAENIEAELTNDSYSWSSRMNSVIKVMKNLEFQTTIMYNGPRIMPQGQRKAMFFVNTGLKYSILDNKLQFSLRLNDVFNTFKFGAIMDEPTFYFNITHNFESRILYFGVTYQLRSNGKQTRDRKKQEDGMMDYDMF